jgi:hypothetical protein
MTITRAHLVDASLTRWYHCVTRCVCRAFLLGAEAHNRKEWIESQLEELSQLFFLVASVASPFYLGRCRLGGLIVRGPAEARIARFPF